MKNISLLILRVGVGITFVWIGCMVLQAPEAWGSFMLPWAADLLGDTPIKEVMIGNGILDILIGISLVTGVFLWVGGVLGTIHLAMVMIVSGINISTVRDIGLFAATLAIAVESLPAAVSSKLGFSRNNREA